MSNRRLATIIALRFTRYVLGWYNTRMTADDKPRKFPRVLVEVVIALALLGLGGYGLSVALQQRPYLGEPATTLLLVPYRVLAAPNVPAIALFLVSGFSLIIGGMWFILRFIHQLFFRPVRAGRVWRQATLIAIFTISVAWLQLNQAFSLALAAVAAAALILLEVFLNIREHNA